MSVRRRGPAVVDQGDAMGVEGGEQPGVSVEVLAASPAVPVVLFGGAGVEQVQNPSSIP